MLGERQAALRMQPAIFFFGEGACGRFAGGGFAALLTAYNRLAKSVIE